jgi:AcrR family transcriptional regulator
LAALIELSLGLVTQVSAVPAPEPSSAGNHEVVGLSRTGARTACARAAMLPLSKPSDSPDSDPAPGLPANPPQIFSRSQRGRLLAGALQVVSEHGYSAATVARIIAAARVSRQAFYEHFANKEECILAAYDLAVDWLGEQVAEALVGVEDWQQAASTAVRTILARLDDDPRLVYLCALEILALGRRGVARYEASIERLAMPLRAGRARCAWGTELPLSLEETVVGGAIWLIGYRARLDRGASLTELAPDLIYFLLAPYLGAPQARWMAVGGTFPPSLTARS